jgi:transposase
MSGDNFARDYSVAAGAPQHRSEDEKEAIIGDALQPEVNVSAIARRHGIKPKATGQIRP